MKHSYTVVNNAPTSLTDAANANLQRRKDHLNLHSGLGVNWKS